MTNNIINFGKYKGQPLEVLQNDKQYTDWLMGQDWFRDRYQGMYTLIVNNFGAPAETPEHNALQALFLDNGLCENLARKMYEERGGKRHYEKFISDSIKRANLDFLRTQEEIKIIEEKLESFKIIEPKTEWDKRDRVWGEKHYPEKLVEENEKLVKIGKVVAAREIDLSLQPFIKITRKEFEKKGADVDFDAIFQKGGSESHRENYRIELKPQLGDDYPAILRQIKSNDCWLLIYKSYTGSGATEEQVKAIFAASNIACIRLDEIQ